MFRICILIFVLLFGLQRVQAEPVSALTAVSQGATMFGLFGGAKNVGKLGQASGFAGELLRLLDQIGLKNNEMLKSLGSVKERLDASYTLSHMAIINFERVKSLRDLDGRTLTELNNSIAETKSAIRSARDHAKRMGIELEIIKLQNEEIIHRKMQEEILVQTAKQRLEASAKSMNQRSSNYNTAVNTAFSNINLVKISQQLEDVNTMMSFSIQRELDKADQKRRIEAKIKEILGITPIENLQERIDNGESGGVKLNLELKGLLRFELPFLPKLTHYLHRYALAALLAFSLFALVMSVMNSVQETAITLHEILKQSFFVSIASTVFMLVSDMGFLVAETVYQMFKGTSFFTQGLGKAINEVNRVADIGSAKEPWYTFFGVHLAPLKAFKEIMGYILVILARLAVYILKGIYTWVYVKSVALSFVPLALHVFPVFRGNLRGTMRDLVYIGGMPLVVAILLIIYSSILSGVYTSGIVGNNTQGFWLTFMLLIMLPTCGYIAMGWARDGGISDGASRVAENAQKVGALSLMGGATAVAKTPMFTALKDLGKDKLKSRFKPNVDPLTGGGNVSKFGKFRNLASDGVSRFSTKGKEKIEAVKGKVKKFSGNDGSGINGGGPQGTSGSMGGFSPSVTKDEVLKESAVKKDSFRIKPSSNGYLGSNKEVRRRPEDVYLRGSDSEHNRAMTKLHSESSKDNGHGRSIVPRSNGSYSKRGMDRGSNNYLNSSNKLKSSNSLVPESPRFYRKSIPSSNKGMSAQDSAYLNIQKPTQEQLQNRGKKPGLYSDGYTPSVKPGEYKTPSMDHNETSNYKNGRYSNFDEPKFNNNEEAQFNNDEAPKNKLATKVIKNLKEDKKDELQE
ncbi:MAG: hypothetical protein CME70_03220 [Halobacteriovorax sp.]|nr:hypothetical protein [Halobacteriovorax sp.]MBK22994.1 hypothetical protein [Halobacteriovorax sp.]